jgi:hypothetical protein
MNGAEDCNVPSGNAVFVMPIKFTCSLTSCHVYYQDVIREGGRKSAMQLMFKLYSSGLQPGVRENTLRGMQNYIYIYINDRMTYIYMWSVI